MDDFRSPYEPTLDITQDPRAGLDLTRPADRVAYKRRLAEMLYLNYQQARERGANYRWQSYGLVADDATILLGVVEPEGPPNPFGVPGAGPTGPLPLNGQDMAYNSVFPDWGTVPGSFACFPFETGAFCRFRYGGHDRSGHYLGIWELNFFHVDEEGKVVHFECWNDSQAFDVLTEKVLGVPGSQVKGLPAYIELFERVGAEHAGEAGGAATTPG
jgi:hypothetical protein